MSSFENNSDTDMQHDETHTQNKTFEETVSASEDPRNQLSNSTTPEKYGSVNQQN